MTISIPRIQGEAPVVVGVEEFVQAGLKVPACEEIPEHWAYCDPAAGDGSSFYRAPAPGGSAPPARQLSRVV